MAAAIVGSPRALPLPGLLTRYTSAGCVRGWQGGQSALKCARVRDGGVGAPQKPRPSRPSLASHGCSRCRPRQPAPRSTPGARLGLAGPAARWPRRQRPGKGAPGGLGSLDSCHREGWEGGHRPRGAGGDGSRHCPPLPPRRPAASNLWTPSSQRSVDFGSSLPAEQRVYAGQGPPPPNPMVVERFQQVISALFQQAREGRDAAGRLAVRHSAHAASGGRRPPAPPAPPTPPPVSLAARAAYRAAGRPSGRRHGQSCGRAAAVSGLGRPRARRDAVHQLPGRLGDRWCVPRDPRRRARAGPATPRAPPHPDPARCAGMAVFDTMRHIRPDVSTVCVGLAASMGAFLLASGHVGKRYSLTNRCAGGGGRRCHRRGVSRARERRRTHPLATCQCTQRASETAPPPARPPSRIMIHQPLGGAQGQAADIEIQVRVRGVCEGEEKPTLVLPARARVQPRGQPSPHRANGPHAHPAHACRRTRSCTTS